MAMFPDVQRKAQEEVDRVVGNDRLPTFEDREVSRWLSYGRRRGCGQGVVQPYMTFTFFPLSIQSDRFGQPRIRPPCIAIVLAVGSSFDDLWQIST